jgi:DNA processing protein
LAADGNLRCWLALRSIRGIGDVTARQLLEAFGSGEAVFRAAVAALEGAGLRRDVAREITRFARWVDVDREISRVRALGADLLCLDDAGYPKALRFTADSPPVLHVRGRVETVDTEAIAVVGSRAASPYGLAVAERLARELAGRGITVVSGLAIGIDGAAHRGALRDGGRTIAVLGCGIDQVYPLRHRRLAAEIAARGALVSELPIGTPPLGPNFPRRNRIVSGLALGVVVVEASERSGSLITARLALEQGREVFAVPGEAGLERTRGTHRLIRQGARLVESAADVIEDALPWRTDAARADSPSPGTAVSADGRKMLSAFGNVTEHVDRLIERSGFEAALALQTLLELELAGEVIRHPGMMYSRRPR